MTSTTYYSYSPVGGVDSDLGGPTLAQLLDWLKQLFERAQAQFRWNAPGQISGSYHRITSSATEFVGGLDFTSVSIGAPNFDSSLRAMMEQLYVAHFNQCLDAHSAERLAQIFDCEAGWDGSNARELSLESLHWCAQFISSYELRGKEVGVFMSPDGEMVLNWPKTAGGGLAEITFSKNGYSLFVTGWDDDAFYEFSDPRFEEEILNLL